MSKPVSEKQLIANRQNARKSTGPKTPAGKTQSSRNSIKHGLLASDLIVSTATYSEDSAGLLDLLHNLTTLHKPVGEMEEFLVSRIATSMWRLKRAYRAERDATRSAVYEAVQDRWLLKYRSPTHDASLKDEDGEGPQHPEVAFPSKANLDSILRYESSIERQLYKALDHLERLQRSRQARDYEPSSP
jgi:hypothetical protein